MNRWNRLRTQLLRGTPGRRFAALHRLRQQRDSRFRKWTILAAGILLMLFGIVLIATPGPGLLAVLLGAGLIATESLAFARALDRLELRVRALLRR